MKAFSWILVAHRKEKEERLLAALKKETLSTMFTEKVIQLLFFLFENFLQFIFEKSFSRIQRQRVNNIEIE